MVGLREMFAGTEGDISDLDFHKTSPGGSPPGPHTLIVLFVGVTGSISPLRLHCTSREHALEVCDQLHDSLDRLSDYTILKGHL